MESSMSKEMVQAQVISENYSEGYMVKSRSRWTLASRHMCQTFWPLSSGPQDASQGL